MLNLRKAEKIVLEQLRKNGYEAYVVGGRVRDLLLGNDTGDIDITTSAEPSQTEMVFSQYKVLETGIKHGTVTVMIENQPIEITTYRLDSEYTDNRHPDNVTFTKSLKEDLARRDFTINAMAYDDENNQIIDYFDGVRDVRNKIIRAVGDPDKRFNEDALRILRGLRFASVLGFEIDDLTKATILKNKELLKNISVERARIELVKLLCGKEAKKILLEYTDVIGVVVPEIVPMKNFDQINPHHIYDVLQHTAHVVSYTKATPYLRIAALLHDIGKIPTFTVDAKGIGHFYGHDKASFELSKNILERLKFDSFTQNRVLTLIKYHDVIIKESKSNIKHWLNVLTPEVFFELIELKRADNLSQNPKYSHAMEFDNMEKIAKGIILHGECFSLKTLAVNGDDLLNAGITDGKKIGETLNIMLDWVINEKMPNDKQKLLQHIVVNLPK